MDKLVKNPPNTISADVERIKKQLAMKAEIGRDIEHFVGHKVQICYLFKHYIVRK